MKHERAKCLYCGRDSAIGLAHYIGKNLLGNNIVCPGAYGTTIERMIEVINFNIDFFSAQKADPQYWKDNLARCDLINKNYQYLATFWTNILKELNQS